MGALDFLLVLRHGAMGERSLTCNLYSVAFLSIVNLLFRDIRKWLPQAAESLSADSKSPNRRPMSGRAKRTRIRNPTHPHRRLPVAPKSIKYSNLQTAARLAAVHRNRTASIAAPSLPDDSPPAGDPPRNRCVSRRVVGRVLRQCGMSARRRLNKLGINQI
jgi:hypothetical protein